MTEEEKIEWAKNHKPRRNHVFTDYAETMAKKRGPNKLRRKIKQRRIVAKDFRTPEKKEASWGPRFYERQNYLYRHNAEWRQAKLESIRRSNYRKYAARYDKWHIYYRRDFKDRYKQHASTFKLPDAELYVLGFTLKEAAQHSPFSYPRFIQLKDMNLFPEPKYIGFRYKKDIFLKKQEPFYLVSELEAMMHVFSRYRHHHIGINTEARKTYLKHFLWTRMLKARKIFDE